MFSELLSNLGPGRITSVNDTKDLTTISLPGGQTLDTVFLHLVDTLNDIFR